MRLKNEFTFGDGFGVFFGTVDQNDLHKNAAYQIVVGIEDDVTIILGDENKLVGRRILIKPMTKHKIQCDGPISLIYLSPACGFALSIRKHIGVSDVGELKADSLPFKLNSTPYEITSSIEFVTRITRANLDSRLMEALNDLKGNLENASILKTAMRCGISRSRLRTLAREQLGVPLSTWVTWSKC